MSDLLKKFDPWLEDAGPAALIIREHLMPVEGPDGVLFPATFAATEDKTFKGGYNIDEFPGGKNICLIDSVGSQANRIEPLFAKNEYAQLVPQIIVKAGNKHINLLEAGHRAGDAIVRCSALQEELQIAFKAVLNGDAEPLARIAPTSLVFGAWDSRDTQAKLPRLIASTIRAFDVRELTRSANFLVQQQLDYVVEGLLPDPTSESEKKEYSKRGYLNALASRTHGGVIAMGDIRRDATLHLVALRLLTVGVDAAKTIALHRYILGLALTAFTHSPSGYLRQGCNLVLDPCPDKKREFKAVYGDGRREDAMVTHSEALTYAKATAKAFGIDPDRKIDFDYKAGPDRKVMFDVELAKRDVGGDTGDGAARKSRKIR
jgi:CRISPR-associated protein Csb1